MSQKYDLTVDNLSVIQSLIGIEQSRIVKDGGMNRSLAYHKACNNVGRDCIIPPIDGPELASWVGRMSAQRINSNKFQKANGGDKSSKNGKFVMPLPVVSTFDESDPYIQSKQCSAGISEALRKSMESMIAGQVLEYEFYDQEDARRVQRIVSHVSKALRWPRLDGDKSSCKTVIIEKVGSFVLRIYRLA